VSRFNFVLAHLTISSLQDQAPDVVYSFRSARDVDATISTCGSGFDTKLIVSTNLADASTYLCNDDDRTCGSNTACSKLDVFFKVRCQLRSYSLYLVALVGFAGCACGWLQLRMLTLKLQLQLLFKIQRTMHIHVHENSWHVAWLLGCRRTQPTTSWLMGTLAHRGSTRSASPAANVHRSRCPTLARRAQIWC
jgi:hypothetical protein